MFQGLGCRHTWGNHYFAYHKPLIWLIKKIREKTQITKIMSKWSEITTDHKGFNRIIRKYYEGLNANKLDNLGKINKFLERHKIWKLKLEIEKLSRPETSKGIELVIKHFFHQEKPKSTWIHWWILFNI